jgi:hypothetical protein|nr:MAG TPA: hypothetical protein [Caudoviricetes sp.]
MAKVDPSLIYILNKTTNKYVGTSILTTADKVLYDLDGATTLKDKIMQMETKISNNLESNLKPYGGNKMNFLRDYNGDGNVYINQNNTLNKVTKYHLMDGKNVYSDLKIKNLEADNHLNITELNRRYYSKEEVDEKDRAIVDGEVKRAELAKYLSTYSTDRDYLGTSYTENAAMNFNDRAVGFVNLKAINAHTVTALSLGLYCGDISKSLQLKSNNVGTNEAPSYYLGVSASKDSIKLYPKENTRAQVADLADEAVEARKARTTDLYKGQNIDDIISKVRSIDVTTLAKVKVGVQSPTTATIANGEIYLQLY